MIPKDIKLFHHFDSDTLDGIRLETQYASKTINRGLNKFSSHGKVFVFPTFYNFDANCKENGARQTKNIQNSSAERRFY